MALNRNAHMKYAFATLFFAATLLFAQGNLLQPVGDAWEVGRNAENGALLLTDGRWSVLPATATATDIWRAFATDEALAAGFGTIWYVGQNFRYTWNGKSLKTK